MDTALSVSICVQSVTAVVTVMKKVHTQKMGSRINGRSKPAHCRGPSTQTQCPTGPDFGGGAVGRRMVPGAGGAYGASMPGLAAMLQYRRVTGSILSFSGEGSARRAGRVMFVRRRPVHCPQTAGLPVRARFLAT